MQANTHTRAHSHTHKNDLETSGRLSSQELNETIETHTQHTYTHKDTLAHSHSKECYLPRSAFRLIPTSMWALWDWGDKNTGRISGLSRNFKTRGQDSNSVGCLVIYHIALELRTKIHNAASPLELCVESESRLTADFWLTCASPFELVELSWRSD